MRNQLMRTLAIDGVTAADLEMMLDRLAIHCLADTIEQYWSADERLEVFHWASATIAARRVSGLLVPPVPDVLAPFIEASAAEEENKITRVVSWSCPCGLSGVYEIKPGEPDGLAVFNAAVQHTEMTIDSGCVEDFYWQIA